MRKVVVLLLALAAAAFAVSRTGVEALAGLDRLGEPRVGELASEPDPDDPEPPRFLADRNRLELEVPRAMPAGDLLALYQLDFPHVRRQIADQEGLARLLDTHPLSAGDRFEVTLTPPEIEAQP